MEAQTSISIRDPLLRHRRLPVPGPPPPETSRSDGRNEQSAVAVAAGSARQRLPSRGSAGRIKGTRGTPGRQPESQPRRPLLAVALMRLRIFHFDVRLKVTRRRCSALEAVTEGWSALALWEAQLRGGSSTCK